MAQDQKVHKQLVWIIIDQMHPMHTLFSRNTVSTKKVQDASSLLLSLLLLFVYFLVLCHPYLLLQLFISCFLYLSQSLCSFFLVCHSTVGHELWQWRRSGRHTSTHKVMAKYPCIQLRNSRALVLHDRLALVTVCMTCLPHTAAAY